MPGDFFDLKIQQESLFSLYVSRVLHFLAGEKIIAALNLFSQWLMPGGKLFVINETPFFGSAKEYLPLYYEKKRTHHPWSGLIEDLSCFDATKKPFVQGTVHLLDEETCLKCIQNTTLTLENISY